MNPIVLVTELFPPALGGSAVLFANVYGGFEPGSVVVLTPTRESAGVSERYKRVGVPIDGRFRGIRPMAALKQHLALATAIRRTASGDAVVHAGRPLPEGLPALLARRMSGNRLKYATWVHGEDLSAALTSREHGWLAKRVCRQAAAVFANSEFTSRLVLKIGVPGDRVHVVTPGVDPSRFTGHTRPLVVPGLAGQESPVLLTVGRLQLRKGHDKVIEAMAHLVRDFPDARYLIAGDGPERAGLEALTARLGLSPNVFFLGAVSEAELPALYARCDIFIMANRDVDHDVEGFGIVFLEAAAAGRPTIAGRSGGAPEAIADGETGIVVDGADVRQILAAVRAPATSPERRAAMGAAGRARVLRAFTWAQASERVRAVQEALGRA